MSTINATSGIRSFIKAFNRQNDSEPSTGASPGRRLALGAAAATLGVSGFFPAAGAAPAPEAQPLPASATSTSLGWETTESSEAPLATLEFVPEEVESPQAGTMTTAANKPTAKNPAGCLLEATDPHLRKSSSYNTVGAKPVVNCNRPVDSIEIYTTLTLKGPASLFDKTLSKDKKSHNFDKKRLEQKSVEWKCETNQKSKFVAESWSRFNIEGKWYRSIGSVRSNIVELPCGAR